MSEALVPPPQSPSAAVRARVADLGYGSGPWARGELERRWGVSRANKTIDEAKQFGWLVSPSRGEFFVPTAADLAVMGWLTDARRAEFVLSRTIAAAGLRAWSLSAWAAERGILLPGPVFVTDLGSNTEPPAVARPRRAELEATRAARLDRARGLTFLDQLIVVPALGRLAETTQVQASDAGGGRAKGLPAAARLIEYAVGRTLDDVSWLFAFLAALDMPRLTEVARTLAEEARAGAPRSRRTGRPVDDVLAGAELWASFFGPLLPNDGAKSIAAAPFPVTLVPRSLWPEVAAASTDRAYGRTQALGVG